MCLMCRPCPIHSCTFSCAVHERWTNGKWKDSTWTVNLHHSRRMIYCRCIKISFNPVPLLTDIIGFVIHAKCSVQYHAFNSCKVSYWMSHKVVHMKYTLLVSVLLSHITLHWKTRLSASGGLVILCSGRLTGLSQYNSSSLFIYP